MKIAKPVITYFHCIRDHTRKSAPLPWSSQQRLLKKEPQRLLNEWGGCNRCRVPGCGPLCHVRWRSCQEPRTLEEKLLGEGTDTRGVDLGLVESQVFAAHPSREIVTHSPRLTGTDSKQWKSSPFHKNYCHVLANNRTFYSKPLVKTHTKPVSENWK